MSVAPFVVGLIAGGAQYGLAAYKLHEREDVVAYSLALVRGSFHGSVNKKTASLDERYVPLRSREHEYYTYVREGWNAKVIGFRDGVMDLFKTK